MPLCDWYGGSAREHEVVERSKQLMAQKLEKKLQTHPDVVAERRREKRAAAELRQQLAQQWCVCNSGAH